MVERSAPPSRRRRHIPRSPHAPSGRPQVASRQLAAVGGAGGLDTALLLDSPIGANRRVVAVARAPVRGRAGDLLSPGATTDAQAMVLRTALRCPPAEPLV